MNPVSWILSLVAKVFIGIFKSWQHDEAEKQLGRDEASAAQAKATIEVIAGNQQGQDAVDNMSEEQLKDLLTKP